MATITASALPANYVLVAAGAGLLDIMEQGTIRIIIGTTLPTPAFAGFFVLGYNEGGFSYSGSENIYIMANDNATHLCVYASAS